MFWQGSAEHGGHPGTLPGLRRFNPEGEGRQGHLAQAHHFGSLGELPRRWRLKCGARAPVLGLELLLPEFNRLLYHLRLGACGLQEMLLGILGGLFRPAHRTICIRDLVESLRQTTLVGGANLIPPMLQRIEGFSYGLACVTAQRSQFRNVEAHGSSAFLPFATIPSLAWPAYW